jgi:hypothetical protein
LDQLGNLAPNLALCWCSDDTDASPGTHFQQPLVTQCAQSTQYGVGVHVGSTLTTASASHVNLINGAQACDVFWQIGSSATLGTSSVFRGNILALTSISVNDSVTIDGRALARNGAVTLINDTISAAHCASGTGTSSGGSGSGGSGSGGSGSGGSGSTGSGSTGSGSTGSGGHNGTAVLATVPRSVARAGTSRCERGFRATVTGLLIRKVVFSLGSRVIATRSKSPFEALVTAAGGIRTLTAHVTFTDGTPAARLHLKIRACAAAKRHVVPTRPPQFTG